MKKITEYLGKPILSVLEGCTCGVVKDALFDRNFKKLKYLVMFTDGEYDDDKFLAVSDIFFVGENAIVIKNDSVLASRAVLTQEKPNPINNSVYSCYGKFLGVVSDVTLDDKNNLANIVLGSGQTIQLSQILSSGSDTLFVQDENSNVKLANFRKKTAFDATNMANSKVTILPKINLVDIKSQQEKETNDMTQSVPNDEQQQTQNVALVTETYSSQPENATNETYSQIKDTEQSQKSKRTILLGEQCLPKSSTTKNNFLIGRKVQKNIYSFNHELIIKKNTKINEKIILLAKSHSKFKELALYSA